MSDAEPTTRHTVLEVFGMRLEVSNPRLAELLTMDAGDALGSDVEELFGGAVDRRVFEQGAPDTVLTPVTPASNHTDRARKDFRARVDALGYRLGFEVDVDGTWSSPAGVAILTRVVDRPLTLAAAAHFVSEASGAAPSADAQAVLFVVDGQQTADVFKVAIRQRHVHHLMRTAAVASLEEIARLQEDGEVDHRTIVLLLAPVADIDVGEMLSVLHAGSSECP